MNPIDYILILLVAVIISIAVFCIRKAKKKGQICIGCPNAGACSGKCGGCAHNCGQEQT